MARLRGAKLSPRNKLAQARPYQALRNIPPYFSVVPTQLNMEGNSTYGDCVTAEEAYHFMAASVRAGQSPQLVVPESVAVNWAGQHGFLNGADLITVIQAMQTDGMTIGSTTYTDGSPSSVDYTNQQSLFSAIFEGTIKIAVAAGQLESAVSSNNGWYLTGASVDGNLDHCVGLTGYGTVGQMFQALGVAPPSNANVNTPACLLYTWSTIGVVDYDSVLALMGSTPSQGNSEAWLRTPESPQIVIPPTPTPPPPGPTPPPPPGPTPPPPTPTPSPSPISLFIEQLVASVVHGIVVMVPSLAPYEQAIDNTIDSIVVQIFGQLASRHRGRFSSLKGAPSPLILWIEAMVDNEINTLISRYPVLAPYQGLIDGAVNTVIEALFGSFAS